MTVIRTTATAAATTILFASELQKTGNMHLAALDVRPDSIFSGPLKPK